MIRSKPKLIKPETVTLILINLAGIMENADESLLPGAYREVGRALHTDPTGLGLLTLFRSLVQSLCYPLAAYLALRHNRTTVIAVGAFMWSAATFLIAFSSTFSQIAISRGLNGVGLAMVIPSIHSLVADLTDETNRGITFGWLQLTGNVGTILGGLFSVLLASTSLLGIPGLRIAFQLVGLISVIGILVYFLAHDPRFESSCAKLNCEVPNKPFRSDMEDMIRQAKSVMKIQTFQVIVAQGIAGSFAGAAFSFASMWLELIGFSHNTVALIWTLFVVGFSLGGLFGGRMGDILAMRYPNSGRIILSQISSGSAIPLAAILLLALPDNPSTSFLHGLVFFVMGVSISWNAPATNNPIFAEIVPKQSRTTVYALDQIFRVHTIFVRSPIGWGSWLSTFTATNQLKTIQWPRKR